MRDQIYSLDLEPYGFLKPNLQNFNEKSES